MKPLLSIVIPNYNNSKYLDDCIGSILRQTYRPLEVLVVDDCSTDDSRRKIEEYMKSYSCIKGIYLDQNKGVSHARNTGAAMAAGEYLTFLDADDYYLNPEKAENEIKLLQNAKGKSIAAYSRLQAVDEKGKSLWLYHTRKSFDERTLKRDLLSEKNMQLPRDYCFERRFFLETGGYTEGKSLYEDTEFLLKIAEICSFVCTGQLGSAYRITTQGLSSVSKERHKKARQELCEKWSSGLPVMDRAVVCLCKRKNHALAGSKELCKDILNRIGLRKKRAWE